MRRLKREGGIGRLCEAGKPGERLGRDEFSFPTELHAGDNGGEVHIAAALACSEQSALNLKSPGEYGLSGIGDSKAAIGVAVKSESGIGVSEDEIAHYPTHLDRKSTRL